MANGVTRSLNAATTHDGDYPSYASDSTSKFIPQIFSRKMLKNYYETTAFSIMANTDFQGEIKGQGDSVIIRKTPVITITDYTVGMTLDYEVPEIANTTLAIDQAKSWAFRLDDIDAVATDLDLMNKFAADAGERLKIAIDSDCLEYVVGKADSDNSGAAAGAVSGGFDLGEDDAPLSITSTNAVETIVYANAVLDEANIPSENRYMVIPAWFAAMLKTSDLRAANITGDSTGLIRNGVVGMIDRTKIIVSNLLYSVTDGTTSTECFYCFAGITDAMTFAAQLTKTETIRIPDSFGDYMRGLAVYGRAVVQPTAMVELYVDMG